VGSPEFDTRLAAYAVIVDDDRILLALWNGPTPPKWTMPGGGVELHETTEQGAVREVLEETGFHVELDGLLGTASHVFPAESRLSGRPRPLKAVRVVYAAHIVGGALANEVDGSTDEARWFPLDEVPSLRRVELVDTAVRLWRDSVRAS
jgi:8-oxo-dGTP diphosphatase